MEIIKKIIINKYNFVHYNSFPNFEGYIKGREEEGNESEHKIIPDYRNTEKFANCDLCCKDKSFENYYLFKRGRKQELYSCVNCWENRKTQLVGDTWTWNHHTFPGPAFYVSEEEEEV